MRLPLDLAPMLGEKAGDAPRSIVLHIYIVITRVITRVVAIVTTIVITLVFRNNFGHSMFFLTNFRPTDYVALCVYGVGWSGVEWGGVG